MNARRKLFFLSGKGDSPAQVFDPASLFASGEPGAWYEPKQSLLFQNAAGTTPVTAADQPVGLIEGRSPYANNAFQGIFSQRPLYKNVSGIRSLFFDPTDDSLDMPLITGDYDNFVFAIAVKPQTADDANPRYFSMATTGFNLQCGYIRNGTLFTRVADTAYNTNIQVPLDNIYIIQHIRQAGVSSIRVNGVNEIFSSGTTPTTNTEQVNKGYLGGGYVDNIGDENTYKMTGNIYGAIFRYGSLSKSQRSGIDTYLSNLAGITL